MKEMRFETERVRDLDRDQIELPINGVVYYAYRPSTNAIALFFASAGKQSVAIALAGVEEFLQRVLEPEAYTIIMKAVREDALEFEELLELAKEIIAEFGENPRGSSAGSSSSRANTGTSSTATSRPRATIRQASRPPVSAD